ncbi:MAG TPA: HIT domain-containing protein [Chromatiaceae bacterium]|jgi:diadenosine tetraphosphate (Ap4A) HIT family hydrolase|nr:HIT domain-containing protein [Chromatiaceae bacterium]
MEQSENNTEGSCLFCDSSKQILAKNHHAYAIRDGYPVTEHHTLIIPFRHVKDYFELTTDEILSCNALLHELRNNILQSDPTVTGFNIGMNAGFSAGQTVFHCHIHLIPRRNGDIDNPRGGVRGVIPDKRIY